MKLGLQRWGLGSVALGVAAVAVATGCGLTKAQDETIAISIENAACQVADAVLPTSDDALVNVVCQVTTTATSTATTLAVKVKKSQLQAFLAENPAPDGGLPGVSKAPVVKK